MGKALNTIKLAFRFVWQHLSSRLWLINTIMMIVLFVVATIISTQFPLIRDTISMSLGGERSILVSGDPSIYTRFEQDYDTKQEVLEVALDLNYDIANEGIVLLKNDDSALPISSDSKVSVFGKNSVDLVYGGSGSSSGNSTRVIDFYSSLQSVGLQVNPSLLSFYQNSDLSGTGRPSTPEIVSTGVSGLATGETPYTSYTSTVINSYSEYNDVAFVVISRVGGEGWDLPTTMSTTAGGTIAVEGAGSYTDHYLELDKNEKDMLKAVNASFEKVIVLMNTPASTFELGFLEDTQNYPNIKACVWMGATGENGVYAVADLLVGNSNFSGRMADIIPYDFTADPTFANFAKNRTADGNEYYVDSSLAGASVYKAFFVEYEEGIYIGYRYWETRGASNQDNNGSHEKTWYDSNVQFPFGYGLSYTTFDYKIVSTSIADGANLLNDSVIEIDVEVTNTGEFAGKEVVQLYYSAPYTSGGIEKSHVVLGAFGKTDVIDAGQSEIITLTMNADDMKSYDYDDANGNGIKGYELEAGEYNLYVAKNSHSWADSNDELTLTYNIDSNIHYATDTTTGNEVVNRFDSTSSNEYGIDIENGESYMTRSNWIETFPTTPTYEEREVSVEFMDTIDLTFTDTIDSPWYTDVMPTQSEVSLSADQTTVKIYDLFGVDYSDSLWDELLNQLTVEEMASFIGTGCYGTSAIDSIALPVTIDCDGPVGFTAYMGTPDVYDTFFYSSGVIVASTFNTDLAVAMGLMIGNESLIGDTIARSGEKSGLTYSGWYAPATNIHRSQFGGRNWEYFSEDPLLSGKMSAGIIKGANEKGVCTYMKHFAVNEQETNRETGTNRGGLITWASEQSMREIYLRPFEIGVKEGESKGIMSSFNRIGLTWAGGSYELLTEVLRDEWGFVGSVITDYNAVSYIYMNVDQMIRAGGDMNMAQSDKPTIDTTDAVQVSCIRQATKNALYVIANSNAMQGHGDGVVYKTAVPLWVIYFILIDIGVVISLAVWGIFVIRKDIKLDKQES